MLPCTCALKANAPSRLPPISWAGGWLVKCYAIVGVGGRRPTELRPPTLLRKCCTCEKGEHGPTQSEENTCSPVSRMTFASHDLFLVPKYLGPPKQIVVLPKCGSVYKQRDHPLARHLTRGAVFHPTVRRVEHLAARHPLQRRTARRDTDAAVHPLLSRTQQ